MKTLWVIHINAVLVCEILKVPIFVRAFFIPSIGNLGLQSGVCCIITRRKY